MIAATIPTPFGRVVPPQLQQPPLGFLYYPGVRCPACGAAKFHIGRVTAECHHCDTALVIAPLRPFEPQEN